MQLGWDQVAIDPRVTAAVVAARSLERIVGIPHCTSTQDVAVGLAAEGAPSGTVVVTAVQTAGRGRAGRSWDDDGSGGSLALSILLDLPEQDAELVPHAFGLAVHAAACAVGVDGLRLKWPNDLIVRTSAGPQKVCGILVERTEVASRSVLVGGIGINVDHRHLAVHPERTSLAALRGATIDRVSLLVALMQGVDAALVELGRSATELLVRYRVVSDTIGRTVVVRRPGVDDLAGVAESIDDRGRLVVRDEVGEHAVLSGTVRDAP